MEDEGGEEEYYMEKDGRMRRKRNIYTLLNKHISYFINHLRTGKLLIL